MGEITAWDEVGREFKPQDTTPINTRNGQLFYASSLHASLNEGPHMQIAGNIYEFDVTLVAAPSSGTKGFWYGGLQTGGTPIASGEKLVFTGETTSAATNNLLASKNTGGGVNSTTKGYIMGGDTLNTIDDLIFSTEAVSQLGATISVARGFGSAYSSSLAGYYPGGGGGSTVIDKLTFGSESSGALGAGLPIARSQMMGSESTTKGYSAGEAGLGNVVNALVFATDTNGDLGSTLSLARAYGAGVGDKSAKIFFMGGSNFSTIDKMALPAETIAAIAATITAANASFNNGLQSGSKGYSGGANNAGTKSAQIEDMDFTAETSVIIASTFAVARSGAPSFND